MNLKTKKIIAREILVLFGVIPLVVIVWIGFEIYYHPQKAQINVLTKRTNELTLQKAENNESLKRNKCYRFEILYEQLRLKYDLGTLEEAKKKIVFKEKREALFQVIKNDVEFNSFQEFEDFIGLPVKDYEKCELENQGFRQKILSLEKEINDAVRQINSYQSKISESWKIEIMRRYGFGYLILVYPVRAIVMLLIWSINTLKKKES